MMRRLKARKERLFVAEDGGSTRLVITPNHAWKRGDNRALQAGIRWHDDETASLSYGTTALRHRSDVAVALANAIRAVLEKAHSRMAAQKRWVLNEKGMAEAAGLVSEIQFLLEAAIPAELERAVIQLSERLSQA